MPPQLTPSAVATIGIDIGKNTLHLVGLDQRGGAWLGLVPRQESTGDRTILGKISKRGNKYLRTLFVQAAHVIPADRARQGEVYGLGSSRHRSGSTATCWQSHWPTSWLVSPGPCLAVVENISR
jgi:hypothetical protein